MGMRVRLVLFAPDEETARSAARAAFARIALLEDIMSDYRPESEVRLLTRTSRHWVVVSPPLFEVLGRALEVAARSGGAFDPTVGPLVAVWREARRTAQLPAVTRLDSVRSLVGWRKVKLDSTAHAVWLDTVGMQLDLGGIAKGYILDQALNTLRGFRVPALLEAGGDIVAGDPPPGKQGWKIEAPGAGIEISRRAESLAHSALSTSGDAAQFVVVNGIRYSHVVDPRTGQALTNHREARVVSGDGTTSDALATALTVLTDREGRDLLRSYPGVIAEVRVVSEGRE
jgi:thiamine biosynthesis lipoprotein